VSDEKLWDESLTSRHLQVLYLQTPIQVHVKKCTCEIDTMSKPFSLCLE